MLSVLALFLDFPLQEVWKEFTINKEPRLLPEGDETLCLPHGNIGVATSGQSVFLFFESSFAAYKDWHTCRSTSLKPWIYILSCFLPGTVIDSWFASEKGCPTAEEFEELDICEGHPSPSSQYHYHHYSPCVQMQVCGEPSRKFISSKERK